MRHISELHAFHGDAHCFIGTMNEESTDSELREKDLSDLEKLKGVLAEQRVEEGHAKIIEVTDNQVDIGAIECEPLIPRIHRTVNQPLQEWTLLMLNGRPFLGFVRCTL